VDAALWFFEAARLYYAATRDLSLVRALFPALSQIISEYTRGTRFNIRVDSADGLLYAGEPGVQLTWMDAKIGDWVVTPRTGKPVEIQALWYNALRTMEQLAGKFRDKKRQSAYKAMADKLSDNFGQFWNQDTSCLYDVINGDLRDGSVRPNQVFAVSLPFPLIEAERAKAVVDKIETELLTPYGLRTLSSHDANYIGHYAGDPRTRDSAYHQGTVWPWLMGPFVTAYLNVHGRSRETLEQVSTWLKPLKQHLGAAGLGSISEIFWGDPPYAPCGCIAQAWSVAETLRVVASEVHGLRPVVNRKKASV